MILSSMPLCFKIAFLNGVRLRRLRVEFSDLIEANESELSHYYTEPCILDVRTYSIVRNQIIESTRNNISKTGKVYCPDLKQILLQLKGTCMQDCFEDCIDTVSLQDNPDIVIQTLQERILPQMRRACEILHIYEYSSVILHFLLLTRYALSALFSQDNSKEMPQAMGTFYNGIHLNMDSDVSILKSDRNFFRFYYMNLWNHRRLHAVIPPDELYQTTPTITAINEFCRDANTVDIFVDLENVSLVNALALLPQLSKTKYTIHYIFQYGYNRRGTYNCLFNKCPGIVIENPKSRKQSTDFILINKVLKSKADAVLIFSSDRDFAIALSGVRKIGHISEEFLITAAHEEYCDSQDKTFIISAYDTLLNTYRYLVDFVNSREYSQPILTSLPRTDRIEILHSCNLNIYVLASLYRIIQEERGISLEKYRIG